MTIYDISRELMSAAVYPGDARPEIQPVKRIADGDDYNLSNVTMSLHNGTHIDAPFHFYEDGETTEKVPLNACVGRCTVIECNEPLTGEMIERMLPEMRPRLLIKGSGEVTQSAAFVLRDAGVRLVGTELLSVGPQESPAQVHLELLGAGVVLLEGLNLSKVTPGDYYLVAAPIKIKGADGSPCRALLLEGVIA